MKYPWARLTLCLGLLRLGLAFTWHSLPAATEQDFAQYYVAIDHHVHGRSLYDPIPVPRTQHMRAFRPHGGRAINWHPPHFHLIVWPFYLAGSLEVAFTIWVMFSVATVVAGTYLIWPSIWLMVVVVWTVPLGGLLSGQTTAVVWVALLLALRAAAQHRAGALGIWLMTATLLKPFLLPLWLWPLRERQASTFGMGLITALVSLALGGIVFGRHETAAWIAQRHQPIPWVDHFWNSSLAALLTPHGQHPATLPHWWGVSLSVLTISAWAVWRWRLPLAESWSLLIMAGLLASPLAWMYYWLLLLPPLGLLRPRLDEPWCLILLIGASWPIFWAAGRPAAMYPASLTLAWAVWIITLRHQYGRCSEVR